MTLSWNFDDARLVEFIKIIALVLNEHKWKQLLVVMEPKGLLMSALWTDLQQYS
jgi:hypothetical protein